MKQNKFILGLMSGVILLTIGCMNRAELPAGSLPVFDHILYEVSDLNTSLAFYHDFLGLRVQSNDGHFAMLQAGNMNVALWDKRWDWEQPHAKNSPPGLGVYPHLKVPDVKDTVNRARQAGYAVIQEPRHYNWGTEAFIADPDGYILALVN